MMLGTTSSYAAHKGSKPLGENSCGTHSWTMGNSGGLVVQMLRTLGQGWTRRHQQKFCEFSCIFEELPTIFAFTPIFEENTPVIRVPIIFLMYTFQILFVCVHSRGQRSPSPDELKDTLHNNIAFPDKLHTHAIYRVMQSYRVGYHSTCLDLRNVVLWNENKQKYWNCLREENGRYPDYWCIVLKISVNRKISCHC